MNGTDEEMINVSKLEKFKQDFSGQAVLGEAP